MLLLVYMQICAFGILFQLQTCIKYKWIRHILIVLLQSNISTGTPTHTLCSSSIQLRVHSHTQQFAHTRALERVSYAHLYTVHEQVHPAHSSVHIPVYATVYITLPVYLRSRAFDLGPMTQFEIRPPPYPGDPSLPMVPMHRRMHCVHGPRYIIQRYYGSF